MTVQVALSTTKTIIENNTGAILFLIVGKGNHSGGVSVLANNIKQYLNTQGIPWRYARLADGGTGVLVVSL